MNIYNEIDYRIIIKKIIKERKKINPSVNFQRLSQHMRMQKPYLSKILKGDAHMNLDHLFLACEFLGLGERESQYMELLLEYSRSGLKQRQDFLESKIKKVQQENLKTETYIESDKYIKGDQLAEYYVDPYVQIIHLFLSVDSYRQNLTGIAADLNISNEKLHSCLQLLEKLNLIQIQGNTYKILRDNLHLPSDSPWTQPNHTLLRLLSATHCQSGRTTDPYRISVTFSSSPQIKAQIQQEFLNFIKTTEKLVSKSNVTDVYQLNFDLFQWNQN